MNNIKKAVALMLALLLVLSMFTSCSTQNDDNKDEKNNNKSPEKTSEPKTTAIKPGKWEGKTFANDWSGIKFTISDDAKVLDKDEIQQLVGKGSSVAINEFGFSEEQIEQVKLKSLYDFYAVLQDGVSSVVILYENMDFAGALYNEGNYLNLMKEMLTSLTSISYKYEDKTEETIAGEKYTVGHFSINDVSAQRYYLRKIDNVMICMITTYTLGEETNVDDFITGIERP